MSWKKVSLSVVTRNMDSKRKPLNQQERERISHKKLYPYIGANKVMDYVDEYLFDEEILCIAEDGGSWGENENCCVYVNEKCWVNNHAHVLGYNGNADLKYLKYYLNKSDLNKYITGSTRGKLTKTALESIQIPLPPLHIQKQIADILDKADALRKKDQELLQKYDDLAQSIFIDMFGDPVKNEMGWELKKLGDICNKITDGTHFSPPSQASGIPYITAKHVKKHGLDFYSNPTYVNDSDHKEIYSRCTPVRGDVIYIKDGATTGIAAINFYEFEFSMLSSLALIKPDRKRMNSYYLTAWLNNENVKETYIRNYMAGAAIKRFTLDKIKRFEVLVPDIKLQNKFEKYLDKVILQKKCVPVSESENLFQSLLQKAFTGKLIHE